LTRALLKAISAPPIARLRVIAVFERTPVEMKARPQKPSARKPTARKSAATGKRAAVAGKAKVTARPARTAKGAKTSSKPVRTTLGADCTIEHAPGLHEQLAKILDDRACVTLDFGALKRCDTAGLQVLAAFVRERREAGRAIELVGLSEHFLATAKLIGLSALFANAEVGA
jgi:ABC-type transporter Mla MlaB component